MRFVKKGSAPDAEERHCGDCLHLGGYVTLWCMDEKARRLRGTPIPGVIHCTEWKPCRRWEDLGWWARKFGSPDIIVFEDKTQGEE